MAVSFFFLVERGLIPDGPSLRFSVKPLVGLIGDGYRIQRLQGKLSRARPQILPRWTTCMSHRRGLKSDSTCLLAGAVRLIKTNGMHRFRWGRRHLLARQPDRSGKVHTAMKAPDSLQPGTLARARVHTLLIEEQSQGGPMYSTPSQTHGCLSTEAVPSPFAQDQ